MLKGQAASQIVRETITEVAEAIGTAEGVEVQVDWIDQKKRRSSRAQDHQRLAENGNLIRERIEGVHR